MFKITDVEKLRDAYTLLAFIRDTTTAEQKSGMAASRRRSGPTTTARHLTAALSRSAALMATLSWCSSRTNWTRPTRSMQPNGSGKITTTRFTQRPMTVLASVSQSGTSCTAAADTGSHTIRSALTFNQKGRLNHEVRHFYLRHPHERRGRRGLHDRPAG